MKLLKPCEQVKVNMKLWSLLSEIQDVHRSCYSCYRVFMSVYLSVCLSVYTITKNNGSIHLKLEHIVVYENSSDEFNIGHCPIKSRSRRDFEIFLHLPEYKLSSPISQPLVHRRKL